eukprot:IDg5155t1
MFTNTMDVVLLRAINTISTHTAACGETAKQLKRRALCFSSLLFGRGLVAQGRLQLVST